mmetsp:Transcript_112997/g.274397  ORF Transcript_112997/g.274397 Transcript_112997/m.274397 type:complete len:86 (-) Transcript_112997:201-458(-)
MIPRASTQAETLDLSPHAQTLQKREPRNSSLLDERLIRTREFTKPCTCALVTEQDLHDDVPSNRYPPNASANARADCTSTRLMNA